jgi:hypothetical protein
MIGESEVGSSSQIIFITLLAGIFAVPCISFSELCKNAGPKPWCWAKLSYFNFSSSNWSNWAKNLCPNLRPMLLSVPYGQSQQRFTLLKRMQSAFRDSNGLKHIMPFGGRPRVTGFFDTQNWWFFDSDFSNAQNWRLLKIKEPAHTCSNPVTCYWKP